MKQKRVLSLLLTFALLIGLLPGMTLGVSAADEHAITVLDSAPATQEVAQGALYKLYMDEVFSDSEGHSMTYELVPGSNGKMTKMATDEEGRYFLSFTDPGLDADTFNLRITATCSEGASKTYALKITLTKAAGGDENQYGYNETPAASVKVYLTISSDGVPLLGADGTPLVHKEINVPYFDLERQGLDEYYRYHTENGEGSYTDNIIVERPTALHLYLYALGVYYLGLDPEDITKGREQINGHDGNVGVTNMDGEVPYEDTLCALSISGSPCSMYMQNFWGHDENLMYYRNHVYPLQSAGWGSTADYILLSDGDTIDVALFTDWSFWNDGGAFTAFDKDEYTVKKGDTLTVQTVKYDTKSVADGGTEEFDPISENLYLTLYRMDETGSLVPVIEGIDKAVGGEDNEFFVDTSKLEPDVYYLLARDERTEDAARYAPATALVTITGGGTTACTHETTETTFKKHDTADGKFDEVVTCKDCGEVVTTTEHYYGDADGNGTLNVGGDFQYLNQIVNRGEELPTEWQKFAADVNEDGRIDGDDIALISAVGRNANIILPGRTQRAYVYYKQDKGVEKHHKTVTLPDYPDADLGGIYKLIEACTDADGDGRCDLCLHCTHAMTEVKDAKDATCTETGYTGDTYCTVCGEKTADGEEIAMLEHADADGDGKCDTCGKQLTAPVPTRKAGYPAQTSSMVQTGMAYLLSDLQAGKIFQPAEGQTLKYTNYYYQRSTDGGETWGPMTDFSDALFGMTTIQVTELEEGTYMYRFYASHDGVNFSTDTWTLTLTVSDNPVMNFSFYVGKDYSGGYPIIKLYNVETDGEGNEILGEEITDAFRYSNFTTTLPDGTAEYDPAEGILAGNYQMFYATLPAGRYMYRAFMKNADTGAYDAALGGMTLTLPTDTNVDGLTGGGTNIYLQCNSFYTTSKKTDNTYFTADEYHVRVDCPIMKCSAVMGDAYVKGNYTYYPTMLYAAGNACLYNSYFYPDIDGYIFTQNINMTFQASHTAGNKSGAINTGIELTVAVPVDTTFGLYFQWNNFNTTEVAPDGPADAAYADRWTDNGDGTKTATYFISKGNSNYTWRLSDDTHVTKSGWLNSLGANAEISLSFDENAPTDKLSHDFSRLGTQTINRDEADIQVNLDPAGFKTLDGKTRVRAYRHWQLINSDAGNIMVEPDYEWHIINELGGDARIETVNGGNATNNWADITPGTEDSFIFVRYNSVDVTALDAAKGTLASGSHGGLYPATNPERVGVIIVGGTGTSHGKADADVDFNIPDGANTTRSMDWDYNYDTWFYNDADPEMTFTVKNANGNVDVSFAMVGFADNLDPEVQMWEAAPEADGVYHLPVNEIFGKLGNKRGGTIIIRMEDSDGVSYRLVRASRVDITATNVSHAGEAIMPGDQVKLSFKGMYRSVNKISGIFNPTTFKPTYYGENNTKFEGTLGQYQKMDNSSVTVTIPEDLTFEAGAETATCYFDNGYTFGSMYAAANPFAFLYNMTDTGVGTNFNAVTVTYYLHHYAKAAVTVSPKVLYTVKLNMMDADGKAVSDVTVDMTDTNGKTCAANEDGAFTLGYGSYSYVLEKSGYVITRGGFTLGSADAAKVVDGILTIDTARLLASNANGWDGKTATEAKTDENGTYLIGSAAELAWFAQQINAGTKLNARLTADIELAGYDWKPMNKFYGTFDGDGHTIYNLYINSTSYPVGLFGYVKTGASVTKLGVVGNVTASDTKYGQAGGIAGYMEANASITKCFSAVNVTAGKNGGGIAGYTASGSVITDCYATGKITTTSTNECFLGGICSSYYNNTNGATLTNCYSTAAVVGSGGKASYIGGISPSKKAENYVNCYYLDGTLSGESSSTGVSGLGTAKTADELKALAEPLGEAFTADTANINGGYPILTWQTTVTPPAGVLGDVNGDGEVDIIDAMLVYAHVNAKKLLADDARRLADVNGDGEVDIIDAMLVYAYVNGKRTSFPAEQ